MTIKKKRKTVRKRKPKQIELPANIPVQVIPDPPKESKIEKARRSLWRSSLFLAGLMPMTIFAFQILVLRKDVHIDWVFMILIVAGLALSMSIANISDDKISKSTKEIAPIVRGFMRVRNGGNTATDNKVVIQDK